MIPSKFANLLLSIIAAESAHLERRHGRERGESPSDGPRACCDRVLR